MINTEDCKINISIESNQESDKLNPSDNKEEKKIINIPLQIYGQTPPQVPRKNFVQLDPSKKDEETDIEDYQCVVCNTNKKAIIFGCGHACVCNKCYHENLQLDKESTKKICPLCRAPIEDARPVFL